MPASLTRTVAFHALHRLHHPDWSAERNRDTYGPLSEYHPHDYTCAVTVSGPLDPGTGMAVDLVLLDRILQEEIVDPMAGRRLNDDLPAFASGRPLPTCEALATHLFARIAARLPTGTRLQRVRVAEDPTLHADCTGLS
ncbi:MAG: 6-carboxytetrahydropterin synthase [Gemmatimonadales bacterium]|nr:6-carboxytetrahydropterin synthase [Gemmatimonadales bacterium]